VVRAAALPSREGAAALAVVAHRHARARSLWPREHGAYAQLALPLLAAAGAGHPGPAAWLMTGAAVAGFLAHGPLLICLGQRGPRARAEAGALARARLIWLASAGTVLGLAGVALATPAAWAASVVAVAAAVGLGALAAKRREKTVAGEIVAALALSGCSLPVALVSGWSPAAAVAAFVGWATGFSAVTLAVWPLAHKRRQGPAGRLATVLVPAAALGVGTLVFNPVAATVSVPLLLAAALVVALQPSPRHLRRVGWGVVVVGVMVVIAVVAVALEWPRFL